MRSCTFAPPGLSPLGGRSSTSSLCRSVVVRWACPSTQLPAHQRFFPGGGAVPEHIRTTLCPPSPTSARQQTFSVRAPSAGTFPPCFALLIPAPHAVDRSSAPAARLPVTDLHDTHPTSLQYRCRYRPTDDDSRPPSYSPQADGQPRCACQLEHVVLQVVPPPPAAGHDWHGGIGNHAATFGVLRGRLATGVGEGGRRQAPRQRQRADRARMRAGTPMRG